MQSLVPAPWTLHGNGFVLLYHLPESFNRRWGFMQDFQHQGYKGWLGAVMLMDYVSSPAGPYQELLFIPGLIHRGGKLGFTVSKIYTSTEISQQSGLYNWGFPKEHAHFEWNQKSGGTQHIKVEHNGELILESEINKKTLSFPFSTKLLPLNRLIQQAGDNFFFTRPRASGRLGFASVHDISAGSSFFPPVQERKPLAVLSFRNFTMEFPPASVLSSYPALKQ
ncbi:acetoacetate decarboxylase family protein [Nafulsella turpanensis]|uniref:acetoacetate decarboxylase family protein n=1 Tax=Nafulsella turpanensis TaxID=1265690 RepID=UPI00034B5A00|nr:acetoacetate decarboxylase family protein [Nafulsella turpanensis]